MFKKLLCTLLVISIILVFGLTAFAAPADIPSVTPEAGMQKEAAPKEADSNDILATEVGDVLKQVTGVTEQFLVTITRPDKETFSTYKSSYVISGVSDSADVRVVLEIYNEDLEKYILMKNTDGESYWDIGRFGLFSKEVELVKGVNKIRILAYSTAQADGLKVEDVQVSKFTVTLLNASIKDKIIQTFVDFTKLFIK